MVSYTIYHSPNAYLGVVLAERALVGLPVVIERRPIRIPNARGVKVADLAGSKEAPAHWLAAALRASASTACLT